MNQKEKAANTQITLSTQKMGEKEKETTHDEAGFGKSVISTLKINTPPSDRTNSKKDTSKGPTHSPMSLLRNIRQAGTEPWQLPMVSAITKAEGSRTTRPQSNPPSKIREFTKGSTLTVWDTFPPNVQSFFETPFQDSSPTVKRRAVASDFMTVKSKNTLEEKHINEENTISEIVHQNNVDTERSATNEEDVVRLLQEIRYADNNHQPQRTDFQGIGNSPPTQVNNSGATKPVNNNENESPPFIVFGKLKVLRCIPKAARISAARSLTRRILDVVNSNDVTSWNILLCFAPSCFQKPNKANKNSPSLATLVKRNIAVFDKDGPILNKLCQPLGGAPGKKSKKNEVDNLSNAISGKLSLGDVKGAVRLLSSDSTIMPFSKETFVKVRDKHPPQPNDLILPAAPTEDDKKVCLSVGRQELRKGITRFNPGSSGGQDCLLPQHLKDLTEESMGTIATDLLDALCRLLNEIVLPGSIPAPICPVFYGAKLFALSKPDGDVRPIAVGITLRRIVAKLCMFKLKDDCKTRLLPQQLGAGISAGGEAAIHSCRRYVKFEHENPKILLKVDFRNAFNSLRRDKMLKIVKETFPGLFPFIWQAYSTSSNLYFGSESLESLTGIQQGDPCGPFLFAISIQALISNLKSEYNVWYLDDGNLVGDPDDVYNDYKMIIKEGNKLGLNLNPSKCELLPLHLDQQSSEVVVSKFRALTPQIKVISSAELTMLGSPILGPSYNLVLEEKRRDLERMLLRLSDIDSHDSYYLLKNSLSIPKLLFFLRSAPLYESESLDDFDNILKRGLGNILNIDMDEKKWHQASLPVKLGGLGVRSVKNIAPSAFISSFYKSKSIVVLISPTCTKDKPYHEAQEAELLWKNKTGITIEDYPKDPKIQANWDLPGCKLVLNSLIEASRNPTERARLLAVSQKHASDWLEALPSATLGLKLENKQFRIACALRLGAKVCHQHTCICGKQVEEDGIHGLSCQKSVGRHPRHSQTNDLIKRALVSGGIAAMREPQGVSRFDGKRPDGMSMYPWKTGKLLLWDFTCGDTLAPSHVDQSSKEAGKVASDAETERSNITNCLLIVISLYQWLLRLLECGEKWVWHSSKKWERR